MGLRRAVVQTRAASPTAVNIALRSRRRCTPPRPCATADSLGPSLRSGRRWNRPSVTLERYPKGVLSLLLAFPRKGGSVLEYDHEFDRDFMRRTLQLVRSYSGPYDATLLLNCLLGLLIRSEGVTARSHPNNSLGRPQRLGVSPDSIRRVGRTTRTNPSPDTVLE